MNSEGLEEMFEGDSGDMCAGKFPLMSMGARAEGLACTDPGARTPIGVSGNFLISKAFNCQSMNRKTLPFTFRQLCLYQCLFIKTL